MARSSSVVVPMILLLVMSVSLGEAGRVLLENQVEGPTQEYTVPFLNGPVILGLRVDDPNADGPIDDTTLSNDRIYFHGVGLDEQNNPFPVLILAN